MCSQLDRQIQLQNLVAGFNSSNSRIYLNILILCIKDIMHFNLNPLKFVSTDGGLKE